MEDVAANRDDQSINPALATADGEGIQQGLRGMFVRSITGVEHRAIDFLRNQVDRARTGMADDDGIGAHGIERHRGIDQRFALFGTRLRDMHVDHIRT